MITLVLSPLSVSFVKPPPCADLHVPSAAEETQMRCYMLQQCWDASYCRSDRHLYLHRRSEKCCHWEQRSRNCPLNWKGWRPGDKGYMDAENHFRLLLDSCCLKVSWDADSLHHAPTLQRTGKGCCLGCSPNATIKKQQQQQNLC